MELKNRIKELKQVEWRKIKPLQPENAKVIMNYGAIEKSIEKHGFSMPFFGWENEGEIYCVDGHSRLEVLSNMQNVPETLPVIIIDAKDKKDAIEILIEVFNQKHNPFDYEILEQWIQIEEVDVAIETINVKVEDVMLDEVEHLEAEEDDFDATPPAIPITVLGDLYEIGEHRLLCGDSTDSDQVSKLMNGQKADMVFTDPPYGVEIKGKFTGTILNDNLQGDEFNDFLTACFNNLKLFNKGNLYISYEIKNHTIFENALLSSGFVFDEIIIWNKDSASFYSNNKYNRKFEPIFFIENGKELKCKPDVNVWDFAKSSSFASRDENNKRFNEVGNYLVAHPTTKPLGLITKPLNNSTKENDLILDVFLGSGSTMVASHQLKRKCYGMELDPKYCDVIIKRMIKLDDTLIVKRNGIDCTNEFKD